MNNELYVINDDVTCDVSAIEQALSDGLKEIDRLRAENQALREMIPFINSCLEAVFDGFSYDGGDMQDHLTELGVLVIEKYDPSKHGECEYGSEEGDDYYVLSDFWRKQLLEESK